ncbi:MAG TPA: hypothetical protein VGI45_30185 [Terracidiphilus sp.]|jgi:hypothetical protein|nr:hypothetical protein [Bryobacteraceae bacterium]
MRNRPARQSYKEFIIEAGTSELEHNFGWNSFFAIENNDIPNGRPKVNFLEVTFKCPEQAINAALVEARRRIDQQLQEAARDIESCSR